MNAKMAATKSVSYGAIELRELVLPVLANHHGTLFAGQGLQMMAKAAFLVARELAQQEVVMASVTGAEFLAPVPVGAQLTLRAWVSRVGKSSMSVNVTGQATRLSEPSKVVLQGAFEMVAVDIEGAPLIIDRGCLPRPSTC